ncbi:uncharacterized protein J3D65DRAFT_657736 [Phyllosticta citribraziliensis]|uniref:Uncharacterized protein n=1 Tax=Phyllosticta citribraziliensis TaxID=989973 RepID=A0ABR1LSR9_9PEZI
MLSCRRQRTSKPASTDDRPIGKPLNLDYVFLRAWMKRVTGTAHRKHPPPDVFDRDSLVAGLWNARRSRGGFSWDLHKQFPPIQNSGCSRRIIVGLLLQLLFIASPTDLLRHESLVEPASEPGPEHPAAKLYVACDVTRDMDSGHPLFVVWKNIAQSQLFQGVFGTLQNREGGFELVSSETVEIWRADICLSAYLDTTDFVDLDSSIRCQQFQT